MSINDFIASPSPGSRSNKNNLIHHVHNDFDFETDETV
jgi:hypothetical protein